MAYTNEARKASADARKLKAGMRVPNKGTFPFNKDLEQTYSLQVPRYDQKASAQLGMATPTRSKFSSGGLKNRFRGRY